MSQRALVRLTYVAAFAAVLLPMILAGMMAHQQIVQEEMRRADAMSGDVLRRSETFARQLWDAHARLTSAAFAPCSAEEVALLRQVTAASSYIKIMGRVEGTRLVCSSLDESTPVELGSAGWTTTRGAIIRTNVDLHVPRASKFLVVQKGAYAAAVEGERLLDVFEDRGEVSIGMVTASNGRALRDRGAYHPKLSELSRPTAFFNGKQLVAVRRSAGFDLAVYAAISEAYLRKRLVSFAGVVLPAGALIGALLAFLIVRIGKRQVSFPVMLASAIRARELEVHYQPIVELKSGKFVGVEALLRWPRHNGPYTRTDLLVRAAEECGAIGRLTEFVIGEVTRALPRLLQVAPDLYVSINVSSADLHDGSIVPALQRVLAAGTIQPQNIVLEATEHSFVDPTLARRTIAELRALGVRVGVDDFGTGFSSLSHLTTLPMDFIKIDRTFVETVGTDAVTSEVASHIVRIAATLGLSAIAEGIETEAQREFLRAQGVELGQGWLFAKALPLSQLLARMTAPAERGAAA